ncbi:hypothetical protein JTB14_021276 [Gonioctena quinquepunctata]|nr:hypothetical protein JTB14_021276 [Gonioctena quinquepunctata]
MLKQNSCLCPFSCKPSKCEHRILAKIELRRLEEITDNVARFPDHELPRWNFTDFMPPFMIVFRVLCGEWIESINGCYWQSCAGGSLEMFMTEDQKKYYNAMKKMGSKKPMKAIPRPRWRPQAIVFEIVTNKKIDMFIMLFIGLNMLTMTMDHYQQKETFTKILDYFNMIFIVIFSTECLMKMFALRYHYFTEPWNLFDLVVVILSILGLVLSDIIEKELKESASLLFALAMSLPALINICLLLFLVMFIFAIFGISFFKHVKNKSGLDDVYNFKTFGQSMILLFQMSTSAGWDGVLDGIINGGRVQATRQRNRRNGDKMYIAVILENYSQATEDVQEGLTDDDYDMYYEIWQQFDPDGTQYIHYDQLSDFLDVLEPPLQIHKPNKYKIVSMDIPICKGDLMFCVDILDALTKDFFARKGNAIEETAELAEVQGRPNEAGYEPVSSTLWRQREEYCARLIQNAWRKHKRNRGGATDPSDGEVDVEGELEARQTAVLVERNGHKVVIHSRNHIASG